MKTRKPIAWTLGAIAVVALLMSSSSFSAETAQEGAKVVTNRAVEAASPKEPASAKETASPKEAGKEALMGNTSPNEESLLEKAMKHGLSTTTTGGIDPHGNSGQSIQNSISQFGHPVFVLRLLLSLSLSVLCAWVIAWHPRRSSRMDPFEDLEERKAFVILGMVGAIVAELSETSQTLAFVIFGIGALLRFRTVLDNAKASGKAILVVVIGLACGVGSWTMAVFVTAFSWVLIFWLDSRLACNMTIRITNNADSKALEGTVHSLLLTYRCRLHCSRLSKNKKRIDFQFDMPAELDPDKLEAEVRANLPKTGESRVSIDVV